MAVPLLLSSFFLEIIWPFVLVFTLIFAILQKTQLLGEGKKQIDAMILSYQYVERPPGPPPPPPIPLEERMETLRENILVADKWKDIVPLFPDKKLINTDAIGIGTGPMDYYYSAEANHTIKLERNSGTVLNIREGETSEF